MRRDLAQLLRRTRYPALTGDNYKASHAIVDAGGYTGMLGRRRFLGTLTAGVAAAAIPAGVISAAGFSSLRGKYANLVDSKLHLMDSGGRVTTARLVSLDDGPASPGIEQFSLLLESEELHDGNYDVYHPDTGTIRLTLIDTSDPDATMARQRVYFSNLV